MTASDLSSSLSSQPPPKQRGILVPLWRRYLARRRRNQARWRAQVKFRLTREGVHFLGILLFIFVGAVIREISLLILLAGAMLGLLLLQWRFNTRTLLHLTLNRQFAPRAAVGSVMDVGVQLINPKRWLGAWLVMVEDPLHRLEPNSEKIADRGVAIADEIGPKGTSKCKYRLTFHQRGKYRLGPSTISTRFPIGLGRGWRILDNATEIVVHPALGEVKPRVKRLFQEQREGHASSSPKVGSHEAEFYGLRSWASGDSKRWIHWRTTARLGELSVRQFERNQQRDLCLLLDLYAQEEHPSSTQLECCERAIAFVASLATRVGMYTADRLAASIAGNRCTSAARVQSVVSVSNLLDELAVMAPSPSPNLDQAIRELMYPLVTNPVLLVVSTRGNQLPRLQETLANQSGGKLLAKLKINWLDVSNGDLEPYFQWTSNESRN